MFAHEDSGFFAAVKAMHRNGSWYSKSENEQYRRQLHAVGLTNSKIWWEHDVGSDEPEAGYRAMANVVDKGCFHKEHQTEGLVRMYGALSVGIALIKQTEQRRGFEFDTVVLARADISYTAPLANHCAFNTSGLWYVGGPDPPDGFWILPRRIAGQVLNSVQVLARELNTTGKCGPWGRRGYSAGTRSWFFVCSGLVRHWSEGLRFASVPSLRGSVPASACAGARPSAPRPGCRAGNGSAYEFSTTRAFTFPVERPASMAHCKREWQSAPWNS